MGVVHLARRPGGERVALKVLRPHIVGDDEARARLAREVSSLTRVRSRWVAEIVDADPWADVPYVATRYVPGLSLHDHVLAEGPITGADLTWFAGCLAEGLASVHDAGVLHRDVKPSNVLMEGRTPILIDFGLARVADDPKLTHTGWLLGTPGYLAPEILYGDDASAASDVHSWAATVAYAGTGRAPFGRGPSMAIMDRVRRGEHDLDRPARRPARPGRGGARPRPRAAPDAGAAGGVAAPADHPDPAGAAPGAGHDGAARRTPSRCRSRWRRRSPPGPCASGPPTCCRPRGRARRRRRDFFPWDDEDEDDPAVRGWDEPAPEPRMSAGRPGPPAAARRRRPPARGRRADGAAVAVAAAGRRRHLVAAQRLAGGQRRGGPPPAAGPAVVRRRAVPGRRALAPRARRAGLAAAGAVERRARRGGRPRLLRAGRRARPPRSSRAGSSSPGRSCSARAARGSARRWPAWSTRWRRVRGAGWWRCCSSWPPPRPPATPWSRTARTGRRPTGPRGAGSAPACRF